MAAVLFFVSGHGFGHAVRAAQVVRELSARGHHCTIATSAPRWIFDANLSGCDYAIRSMVMDEGVFQIDSLRNDLAQTYGRWKAFLDGAEDWLNSGMALVRETGAVGIISDIAPLAFPLARRAGLPSVLEATFTWDCILDFYRDDNPGFAVIAREIRTHYLMADAMIYTPFAYGLPPVEPSFLVPLIAKKALHEKREIRDRLGWDDNPHFFISFGGYGVNGLDGLRLREMPQYLFVFLGDTVGREGNIIRLKNGEVSHHELVAACDAVIGKPGYGTVSECVLNRTPLVYTSRGKFAEYEPMVAEMEEYVPTLHIPHKELFSGGLRDYLGRIPAFERKHKTDSGTGASDAADIICRRFGI